MSTPNFLRENNDCGTAQDKANFKKLVELLSKADGFRKLKEKATTCFKTIPQTLTLDRNGLEKLKTMFPNIKNINRFAADIGGKRKSKKRHYKHIIKMKTTKTAKTLRNKILKRRRSRKRDRINRRKSRKINLYK